MENRPFLAPFWFLLSVTLFLLLTNWFLLQSAIGVHFRTSFLLFYIFLWPVLVLIEAVVYFVIRNKIYDRKWAWVHVLAFLIIFVVLKLMMALAPLAFMHMNEDDYRQANSMLGLFDNIVFWAGLILGHVGFGAVLVKAFSKKNEPVAKGIFDE